MNCVIFLFGLALSISALAADVSPGTGLKLNAAADTVGFTGAKNQTQIPKKISVREAEFSIYGPLDHGFDGMLSFAAHDESGVYNLELHEAYLSSSKLVDRLRVKAGKFFLGVGRLNQYHRHDWPFITTPKVQKEFFDEEAVADTGLEGTYLLPILPYASELTIGATNGWTFGHTHSAGSRPSQPTHYTRWMHFLSFGETVGLQVAGNYLGRRSRADGSLQLFGADITLKFDDTWNRKWLLQSEVWGKNLRPVRGDLERTWAAYLYLQRQIFDKIYFGSRVDGFSIDTTSEKNLDYSVNPVLTYKHSEFVSFRAGYQWDFELRGHKDSLANRVAMFQVVFILGDHPAHDF